jgi:DNA invertase Pin-like site-specific DNA recombinase
MAIIVGYARVSTGSQSYVDQVAQLERAGVVRIFREKESGARSDRPQLAKAIASLDEGDVLLVTRHLPVTFGLRLKTIEQRRRLHQ